VQYNNEINSNHNNIYSDYDGGDRIEGQMSKTKPTQKLISITPVAGQRLVINLKDLKWTLDAQWPMLLVIDFTDKVPPKRGLK